MWYLYILRCVDGSLYTGITMDPERRLAQHNAGKGSKSVRARRPARLVYREAKRTRASASRREAEIKSWPRARKLSLLPRPERTATSTLSSRRAGSP